MAAERKRFTISVTPSMELDLDAARKARYDNGTQTEMLRDLIVRGLASLKAEDEERKPSK